MQEIARLREMKLKEEMRKQKLAERRSWEARIEEQIGGIHLGAAELLRELVERSVSVCRWSERNERTICYLT